MWLTPLADGASERVDPVSMSSSCTDLTGLSDDARTVSFTACDASLVPSGFGTVRRDLDTGLTQEIGSGVVAA